MSFNLLWLLEISVAKRLMKSLAAARKRRAIKMPILIA